MKKIIKDYQIARRLQLNFIIVDIVKVDTLKRSQIPVCHVSTVVPKALEPDSKIELILQWLIS